MKTKKERCCGLGACRCEPVEEQVKHIFNKDFEKKWSYFLRNVDDPEHYMKGQIKEACRLFHRTVPNEVVIKWLKNH